MCFSFKWKYIIISFFSAFAEVQSQQFELLEFFMLSFHTHAISLSLTLLFKDCYHDYRKKKWKSEMNMEICTRKKRSLIFVCLLSLSHSSSPTTELFKGNDEKIPFVLCHILLYLILQATAILKKGIKRQT